MFSKKKDFYWVLKNHWPSVTHNLKAEEYSALITCWKNKQIQSQKKNEKKKTKSERFQAVIEPQGGGQNISDREKENI